MYIYAYIYASVYTYIYICKQVYMYMHPDKQYADVDIGMTASMDINIDI